MPRKARKHSSSGVYHIIFRGVNKQNIFEDDDDHSMFLVMLKECCTTIPLPGEPVEECLRIYMHVEMSNHIHLLVREILTADDKRRLNSSLYDGQKIGISLTMHRLARKYSMWFNKKYGRTGHLFQDRFNSEPVEDNNYFLTCFRYIARNAYKAGMVSDPDDYRWSGWYDFIHPTSDQPTSSDSILQHWSLPELRQLVHSEPDGKVMDFEEPKKSMDDKQLKEIMEEMCGCSSVSEFQKIDKQTQEIVVYHLLLNGAGQMQIVRNTGLSREIVRRISRRLSHHGDGSAGWVW